MINKLKYKLLLEGTVKKFNGSNTTKELLDFIENSKPRSLFRYRACNDYTLQALFDGKIFFSSSNKFNDPYDCLLYFDVNRLKNEIKYICNLENFEEICKHIMTARETGLYPPQLHKDVVSKISALDNNTIHSRLTNTTDLNQLKNLESFYLKELNENAIGLSKYYSKYVPISCFSEKPNNILMWSHYADSHRGFVLEYDTNTLYTKCDKCQNLITRQTCLEWKTTMLFPIMYTNQRYDATQFLSDHIIMDILNKFNLPKIWDKLDKLDIIKAGIYKHTKWSYEREWRLFLFLNNIFDESYYSINVKPISIYLGCRILPCYEKLLTAYAKDNKIKLYKMSDSPSKLTYRLHKINLLK